MDVTLDGLETLDAIVRNGSFAAAARELNRAQSAVSYAVARLEERLGVSLFDRSGHRAELTEAGRVVLDAGRNLLADARRIESLAGRLDAGWEPRFEIVIDGILPMKPIMRVLKQMAEENVPTRIQIRVEFLGGVQYRFEADRADMMLVKDFVPRDTYETRPLNPVECVLVAAADHPLVAHATDDTVSLRTLREHVELTVHDSSESTEIVDDTRFGGERVFHLSDFQTKKLALELGLGFGWMPTYLVDDELRDGALVEIAYERGSRYTFTPVLIHPVDRPLGRAGARFVELLRR